LNEWNCPKKINNSFDVMIAEDIAGIRLTKECKCCGVIFKLRNQNQKFCCRLCSDTYHNKMEEAKSKYGNSFKQWLGNEIKSIYY
jgi:transposase